MAPPVMRPESCEYCGNGPMVSRGQEGIEHGGRGLCRPCYRSLWYHGFDTHYRIRPYHKSADLMEDLEELRAQGCTIPQAAERLNMKFKTLEKAIERHKKRQKVAA